MIVTYDDTYIVSASKDKTVRVWDLKKKREKIVLRGHIGIVNEVAVTYDNLYIASGSSDCSIRVWNLQENIKRESCYII